MNYQGKTVLLTIYNLDGYHGSVTHVYELSEYYSKNGAEVTVVCVYYSEDVKEMFEQTGIRVYTIGNWTLSVKYDYVIGIHNPVLSYLLLRGLDCDKLILTSLSHVESLECFPVFYEYASLLTSHSVEAAEVHIEKYGIDAEKIKVIENFIPEEFISFERVDTSKELRRIAVVSNHIPEEIKGIVDCFGTEISVDFYGMHTDNFVKITPEIIKGYDVIISIGKTVQYALGMGVPVYIYDHFGGNGYLFNIDDMKTEAKNNFTGRPSCRHLTASEIAKEIVDGYEKCLCNMENIRKTAIERFGIAGNADRIIDLADKGISFNREGLMKDKNNLLFMKLGQSWCTYNFHRHNETEYYRNRALGYSELLKEQERLKTEYAKLSMKVVSMEKQIENMEDSTCWKITKPIRDCMDIVRLRKTHL